MTILIPLFVAARKRDQDSVWDIPIAAMVLSTSQVFISIFPILLSDGCESLFDLHPISRIWQRVIFILLLIGGSLPIVRLARKEWRRDKEKHVSSFTNMYNNMTIESISLSFLSNLGQTNENRSIVYTT